MKLYRIVHKSLKEGIWNRPQSGAIVDGEIAYILAFDTFSMAVLEHPFDKLVLGFPSTFCLVSYHLPEMPPKLVFKCKCSLYQEKNISHKKLGSWVSIFNQSYTYLVAECQSDKWPSQVNFIINVRHPLFSEVVIDEILALK